MAPKAAAPKAAAAQAAPEAAPEAADEEDKQSSAPSVRRPSRLEYDLPSDAEGGEIGENKWDTGGRSGDGALTRRVRGESLSNTCLPISAVTTIGEGT